MPRPSLTIAVLVALAAFSDAFQPTSFTFDRIRYTFYPGEIARTWTEADAFCQSLNKELAVFANRAQIRNVSEYLSPEGGVWTGYKTNADGRFEASQLAEFEWKKEFGTPLLNRARPDQCGLLSVANYTGIVATDCDTRKAALCSVSDPDVVEVETMMDAKSGLAPTAPKPTPQKLLPAPANKTSTTTAPTKRAGLGAEAKPPAPAPKPTPEAAGSKKAAAPTEVADDKSTPEKTKKTADDDIDAKPAYKSKTAPTEPKSAKATPADAKPAQAKTAKAAALADDDLPPSDDADSKRVADERHKAEEEHRQAEADKREAELDRKKAEDERKRAEEERRQAAEERKRAADDKKKADDDKKKVAEAKKKASDAKKKVSDDKKKPKAASDKDGDEAAAKKDGDESSEPAPTPAPTTRAPTNQLPVQVESEGGRFTFFPNHIMFGGYMEYARFCEDKGLQPAVFTSRKQLDDIAAHVQSVVMVWTGYTTDTMGGVHSADERNGPWSDEFAVPEADPAPGLSCGALATVGERIGVTMGSCASAHEALCSAKPFADMKPAPLKKK